MMDASLKPSEDSKMPPRIDNKDKEVDRDRLGSWQCPKCYIISGFMWRNSPSLSKYVIPTCCGGIEMVAYTFLPNKQLKPTSAV